MKARWMTWFRLQPWDTGHHEDVFFKLLLLASLFSFSYTVVIAQAGSLIIQAMELDAWFYALLVPAVLSGQLTSWLRALLPVAVRRSAIGSICVVLPSVFGAIGSLFRGGWTVTEFLAAGVAPGLLILVGYALSAKLYDICASLFDEPEDAIKATGSAVVGRGNIVERHVSVLAFKAWGTVALLSILLAEGAWGQPAAAARVSIAAVIFTAIGLVATFLLMSLIHLFNKQEHWAMDVEEHVVRLSAARWLDVTPIIVITVAAAWMMPANVSPIARQGLGSFWRSFNEWIGPYFMFNRRSVARTQDATASSWLRRLFMSSEVDADGGWIERSLSLAEALMKPIVLLAVGFAAWRLYRLLRPRNHRHADSPQYAQRGLLAELFFWLWARIRNLLGHFSSWLGAMVGTSRPQEANQGMLGAVHTDEGDEGGGPIARIRFLFAQLLVQLGRAGYPRMTAETPFEYVDRISALRPDAEAALAEAVDIYVKARYGKGQEPPLLERAYESLKVLSRQLTSLIRRMSAIRRSKD